MFSLRSAAMSSDRGVELVGEIYGSSACVRVCVCGHACLHLHIIPALHHCTHPYSLSHMLC